MAAGSIHRRRRTIGTAPATMKPISTQPARSTPQRSTGKVRSTWAGSASSSVYQSPSQCTLPGTLPSLTATGFLSAILVATSAELPTSCVVWAGTVRGM